MGIEIGKSKFSNQDKIDFLRTLSSWMSSGGGSMSISDCVKNTCDAFSTDEFKLMAPRMLKVYEEYSTGQTKFSIGLRDANIGFNNQEITILNKAEDANQLAHTVESMVEAMNMQLSARNQLWSSLRGPMISGIMLIIMTFGVAYFMLPIVLGPTLDKDPTVLAKFPFVIRWFWYFSEFLNNNPLAPLFVLVMPVTYLILYIVGPMKKPTEKVLMWLSATRRIMVAYNGLLLVYFMPALVKSGMPFYDVLRSLSEMLDNSEIRNALIVAANDNEAGVPLSECVTHLPLRVSFKNAISAGEKTGAVSERVTDLKIPYSAEYDRLVTKFVGTIKFLVMAVLLPCFIMSMYTSLVAPIFALLEF
ncbi:MAG: hypothetical protein GY793_09435 [Proteobacteria bacterium]|nr:hypothetical protein [Pseudomonadota bacterium]